MDGASSGVYGGPTPIAPTQNLPTPPDFALRVGNMTTEHNEYPHNSGTAYKIKTRSSLKVWYRYNEQHRNSQLLSRYIPSCTVDYIPYVGFWIAYILISYNVWDRASCIACGWPSSRRLLYDFTWWRVFVGIRPFDHSPLVQGYSITYYPK